MVAASERYLRIATMAHRDYDILTWQDADGWNWRAVEVRGGKDRGIVAEGVGPTEAKALAAADAAVAALREVANG